MRRHDAAAASKDISGDAGGNVAPAKQLKVAPVVPLPGGAAALCGIDWSAGNEAVVSVEVKDTTLQKRIGKLLQVKDHSSWRMRYHAFVSHAQLEASGDVGTVFFLGESLGLHGWRDMNQPDLTAQGMMQGVFDSDVFILFLTCSVLSRKYCQMEIGWAMAFDKPIVIIYEEEERFFSFDLHRWQNDLCVKAPLPPPNKDGTYDATVTPKEKKQGFRWADGLPLGGLPHAECPTAIHDWITAAMKASAPSPSASSLGDSRSTGIAGASSVRPPVAILPFRRRDFEVSALMRELVRCVGRTKDVPWGRTLPPTLVERAVRSPPAKLCPPRVHLIWDGSSKRATAMKESLGGSLEGLNERYGYSADRRITCTGDVSPAAGLDDVKRATHILVMLTDTHQPEGATPWLASTTAAAEQLAFALEHLPNPSRKVTYIYDKPKGLNSTVFTLSPSIENKIKHSIWGHEALVFRDQDGAQRMYEHESMVRHIVGLMATAKG